LSDTRTWEDVYAVKSYDYLEILVKGGTPVWDKEENKFIDKDSKVDNHDELESELTMGVENVKSNIKTAETTTSNTTDSSDEEEEEDDLPF
jgi:hypothetical protein